MEEEEETERRNRGKLSRVACLLSLTFLLFPFFSPFCRNRERMHETRATRKSSGVCREGSFFSARDKSNLSLISATASAQDLRSLDLEKEARKAVEELSPRGVLDNDGLCSDSETSSSKASTSNSWVGFLRLWHQKSMRRLSTFPRVAVPRLLRGRSNREAHLPKPDYNGKTDSCLFKPSWKSFSIGELQKATDNFNPRNIVGKGGYAEVYEGCLENGEYIAVKKIIRGTADERTSSFLSELGIILQVNHPNTSKLIGFGVEGGMHLVFRLSGRGCLASLLHGSEETLDWSIRYKVAIGIAEGLEYLHERCQRRIIHRDIKSANILVTQDFEPQICDFGLAKWLPDNLTHHTVSNFEGTFGYLAPEYLMHGIVNEKTDVFAFGVLLLELITGRKAVDSSQQSLVMWAKPFLEKNNIRELVDPSMGDTYDRRQLNLTARAASLCIQNSSTLRPRTSQVLKILRGDDGRSDCIKVHQKFLLHRTYSEELFDVEEYNATRYLNDLKQHRQLALNF